MSEAQKTKRGFFAVDVRCSHKACCDINMATAYLVMACGTGGDNSTTSWSVSAIERYTRISRSRAATAIKQLIAAKLAVEVKPGSRPRYRLLSYQEIVESELPFALASVLQKIKNETPLSKQDIKNARQLVSRGLAVEETSEHFQLAKHELQLAWLPNAFVCGADDETPPLERLRRYGDPMLLRLAVDLYEKHLENDGGIAKGIIFGRYDRELKASIGTHRIFEFRWKTFCTYGRGPALAHAIIKPDGQKDFQPFWDRMTKLADTGVMEWMPTLFENESEIAEPIIPLGIGGTDSTEDQLGSAAHAAAAGLLARYWNLQGMPEGWKVPSSASQLVPVPQHFEQAALLMIARLRYRPHTERTSKWFSQVAQLGTEYLETYRQIITDFAPLHAQGVAA